MILTYLLFSIALLVVAPLLTSLLLPPLSSSLARGRRFKTWVLITYRFYQLSLFIQPFAPTNVSLSLNFQKARWDDFVFYFDSHCLFAVEYLSLFLFSATTLSLFTSLTINTAKPFIPLSRIKRQPKAWWSAKVEDSVSERCKAFAAAHRSNEDRQAYISASRRASSDIAKAKAETRQATCSSLSPKSNPISRYSLLHSVAG